MLRYGTARRLPEGGLRGARVLRKAGGESDEGALVLITDLYEGDDVKSMIGRAAAIKQSGVNFIVLLALSDSGQPAYEAKHAEAIASLGCPGFACTPDQFPSMLASALTGKDLKSWAAEEEIALIRGS